MVPAEGGYLYILWFSFVLGLIFIFLCSKFIIIHYPTLKQRKIKIKLRIKLNHNIYMGYVGMCQSMGYTFCLDVNLKIAKSTLFKRVFTDVSAMLPPLGYKTKYC